MSDHNCYQSDRIKNIEDDVRAVDQKVDNQTKAIYDKYNGQIREFHKEFIDFKDQALGLYSGLKTSTAIANLKIGLIVFIATIIATSLASIILERVI